MEAEVLKKSCPYCKEFMNGGATVCPHCQRTLVTDDRVGCGYLFIVLTIPLVGLILGILFAVRPETGVKGRKMIIWAIVAQVIYAILAIALSTAMSGVY